MIDETINSETIDKRISIVTGHFGSGKTEFAVNYALDFAKHIDRELENSHYKKVALIDLDIANPYFRSREKQAFLESKGIEVLSNTFGYDINLDLPAISARINGPLQDKSCRVIMDVGGDRSGARVLTQFKSQFINEEYDLFCLINANRSETASLEGAAYHISAIEKEVGLKITGIINNTHLLKETKIADIIKGVKLCRELSFKYSIPVKYHCCIKKFDIQLKRYLSQNKDAKFSESVFVIDIMMRTSWLDK